MARPVKLRGRLAGRLFVGSTVLVAYAFAGYPLLLALLARLRPRPVLADDEHTPRVSLVIAAYNEEKIILERLSNCDELDYPRDRLEVIVVADGSDDRTAELASTHPGVHVLHTPERSGKLAALNRAVAAATGDVFVFSDANNRYTRDTLRELVAPFADPNVGVVTGRKAIDDGTGRPLDRAEGLYWRYEDKLKRLEARVASVTGVAGEILAFRRGAYISPPEGTMNEDFVQAMLAALDGWRVAYAPEAVSLERASATIEDEATRRTRLVTGRAQAMRVLLPQLARRRPLLAWQVASHKGLRPLVPWALLAAALSNARLTRSSGWARALFAAQLLFYAAAAAGWQDERQNRRRRWSYLPFYFCRMNVAAVGGMRDFAARRREAVWAKVDRG